MMMGGTKRNPPRRYCVIMKLKSIFTPVRRVALLKAALGANPKLAAPRIFRSAGVSFALLLIVAAACAAPAPAQQSDLPSAQKSDTAPQTGTATAPDPPPEDAPEAMFPHFNDSRFWLSGQANFIFQTHPPFYAAYSGKNSLSPNY